MTANKTGHLDLHIGDGPSRNLVNTVCGFLPTGYTGLTLSMPLTLKVETGTGVNLEIDPWVQFDKLTLDTDPASPTLGQIIARDPTSPPTPTWTGTIYIVAADDFGNPIVPNRWFLTPRAAGSFTPLVREDAPGGWTTTINLEMTWASALPVGQYQGTFKVLHNGVHEGSVLFGLDVIDAARLFQADPKAAWYHTS